MFNSEIDGFFAWHSLIELHAHEREPPSISGCPHIAAQPIGIKVEDVADLVHRLGIEKYNLKIFDISGNNLTSLIGLGT